jgi:hypothetical protein
MGLWPGCRSAGNGGALLRFTGPLLSGKVKLKAKGRQVVIYDQDGHLTPYLLHPIRARGIDFEAIGVTLEDSDLCGGPPSEHPPDI